MYDLAPFRDIPLDADLLEHLLDEHRGVRLPRLARLWRYFRNDLAAPDAAGGSSGAPAQCAGLPQRLRSGSALSDDRIRREVVIENDIGWRIQTLVDFMFPAPLRINSTARDASLRARIEQALTLIINANGGMGLWQDIALLGSVYGHIDLLVDASALFVSPHTHQHQKHQQHASPGEAASDPLHSRTLATALRNIRIQAVEAPRAIALLHPHDYRAVDAFIVHHEQLTNDVARDPLMKTLFGLPLAWPFVRRDALRRQRRTIAVTEIYSADHVQRYEDERLVSEHINHLGRVPVVHIQNLAQPFTHEGLSDVEPLIPLQDELNTRLSDRANRVTMQSFRMWLGKGIEGFTDRPIGPGQMWMTDNEDASIESFGGDADSPSERQHIEDLREALDKTSGVTPAAAGHINAKVGNLTSENALRISLMGTIAKVKRKRITYGRGIAQLCELLLHALDRSGTLPTRAADRNVELAWPDPLPADESRRLDDALRKAELGVPLDTLRAELGYGDV
ncbi:MAG: phage portal protein [Phycisphaerales bacterium]